MMTHPERWELLERTDSELDSLLEPESPTKPFRGRGTKQSIRILTQVQVWLRSNFTTLSVWKECGSWWRVCVWEEGGGLFRLQA